jgi:hypothetical protein
MGMVPHIALSRGNCWESAARAGSADQAHIAQARHNPLKNHNRARPHIAALYPAIVRLW